MITPPPPLSTNGQKCVDDHIGGINNNLQEGKKLPSPPSSSFPLLNTTSDHQDNTSTTTIYASHSDRGSNADAGTGTTMTDAEYWENYVRKNKSSTSNKRKKSFSTTSSKGCNRGDDDSLGGDSLLTSIDDDFNPKDYSLVYEQVLKDRECSELFLAFLRLSRAEELLEFLFACNEYRKFHQKWSSSQHYYYFGNVDGLLDNIVVEYSVSLPTNTLNSNNSQEDDNNISGNSNNSRNSSTSSIELNDNSISSDDMTILQVNQVSHLTKLISKVKKQIIEKFIQEESEKELHRGPAKSQVLKNWQSIIMQHNELLIEDCTNQNYSTIELKRRIISEITNKLDPNIMFTDLYNSVYLDLQVDMFPWFCKHPEVLRFLKGKGEEYTRSIAIKNFTFNILDWRIKERDVKEKIIRREHFYFGFSLLEETKDWKVIRDEKNVKASISKQLYTFDRNLKMSLRKFSTTIPSCSLERFWSIWSNFDSRIKLDPNCEFKVKECHTASNVSLTDLINPFAYGTMDCTSRHYFSGSKKYRFIYTAIEEPSIDSIFMIGHSFQEEENQQIETATNSDCLKGFFFYLFKNLKETNETRIEMCYYMDMKIIFSSLHNSTFIKHCKHFTKTIQAILSQDASAASSSSSSSSYSSSGSSTNNSNSSDIISLSPHNDSLNYNKILQRNKELKVSYYDDWVKLKNNQK